MKKSFCIILLGLLTAVFSISHAEPFYKRMKKLTPDEIKNGATSEDTFLDGWIKKYPDSASGNIKSIEYVAGQSYGPESDGLYGERIITVYRNGVVEEVYSNGDVKRRDSDGKLTFYRKGEIDPQKVLRQNIKGNVPTGMGIAGMAVVKGNVTDKNTGKPVAAGEVVFVSLPTTEEL